MRNLLLLHSSYCRLAKFGQSQRRGLLSVAYGCQEAWELRHSEPALTAKPSYELIFDVRNRFVRQHRCSAIDLDVATCAAEHEDQLDELKRLIYDSRHLPDPPVLMESTQYALGRLFLTHRRLGNYLEMLKDPINYGVFPNNYSANLILDNLLESPDKYEKVGSLDVAMALFHQELFGGDEGVLSSCLTILACLEHLYAPVKLDSDQSNSADSSADLSGQSTITSSRASTVEEDVYVFRFPWLKSTYRDSNFDLVDESDLVKCGHLLMAASCRLPPDSIPLGRELNFLGSILVGDIAKASKLLENMINKASSVRDDANIIVLRVAKSHLDEIIKTEPKTDHLTDSKPSADTVAVDSTDGSPPEVAESDSSSTMTNPASQLRDEIGKLLEIKSVDSVENDFNGGLLEVYRRQLLSILPELEAKDIRAQLQLFSKWADIREQKIKRQVDLFDKQTRFVEIQKELQDLQDRLSMLRFLEEQKGAEEQLLSTPVVQEDPSEVGWKDQEILKALEKAPIPDDADYKIPELGDNRAGRDASGFRKQNPA